MTSSPCTFHLLPWIALWCGICWTPSLWICALFFRVVGIFTAAFNMHYNMPVYYEGMQPYSPASMLSIVFSVFAMVLVFYIPISLCGYFNFGSSIQSNILRNFGDDTRSASRLPWAIALLPSSKVASVSWSSSHAPTVLSFAVQRIKKGTFWEFGRIRDGVVGG